MEEGKVTVTNSDYLGRLELDQRAMNRILLDDGKSDVQIRDFWNRIGFPYHEGTSESIPVSDIITNAAHKVVSPTPLTESMWPTDLKEFFRQRGIPERWVEDVFKKINLNNSDRITLGNFLVRLVKGVASPDTLQG